MPANVWVYKCNRKEQDFARAYGDWKDVFRNPKTKQWGGSWCTGNSVSKHIINELMQDGDLVLAYQTNDRNLVGVCRLAKITGERNERILFIKVERAAVRFVSAWYRREGWKVKSVEAMKCGYDLLCRRTGSAEHVEVKGVAGG